MVLLPTQRLTPTCVTDDLNAIIAFRLVKNGFCAMQEEFDKDLIPIEESFKPLVLKCKELGRAMRIGTNHGSLSARVLSYYGDTPRGMVESAVEFANICRCVVEPA